MSLASQVSALATRIGQEIKAVRLAKADDVSVVHLSGAETVGGVKTFSSAPVVPEGANSGNPVRRDDTRLTDARTPTAHAHAGADITSGTVSFDRLPVGTSGTTIAAGAAPAAAVTAHEALTDPHPQYLVQAEGDARYPLTSSLAAVATSGSYNDLTNKPAGSQTVNYYQPVGSQTFTSTAGSSNTFTLSEVATSVLLVFLNGQQLQPAEYSLASSTQVTVTPVEGAFTAGEAVSVMYARNLVVGGTVTSDVEIVDSAKGVILRDRVNSNRYRLFMSNGVLGTEAV